jgi:hypothetical protein
MHKNIPVADIVISDVTGGIEKKGVIHNQAHLPLGTTIPYGKNKGSLVLPDLHKWWVSRCIPASRDGLRDVLDNLGGSIELLLTRCYGLSLSDQYWVCPTGSGLRWEDVNFFENGFSNDVGEILFGHEPENPDRVEFNSPDITSEGNLQKKWIIVDGRRVLLKGSHGAFMQEPFNEVIATAVCRRLDIDHIPYTLSFIRGKPYSMCDNFITTKTELVSAHRLTLTVKQGNNESSFTHFLRCVDEYQIPNVQPMVEQMIVLDYIIANHDRHWVNFGFIRDAGTLEWRGMAPIFDSGSSLWSDSVRVGVTVDSKAFHKSHSEQLKLIEDFSWFNSDALYGLDEEIMDIFTKADTVDNKRSADIAQAVLLRCNQICDIAATSALTSRGT